MLIGVVGDPDYVPCVCATHSQTNWLRTNGVNTNGATAKVMNFDRLGKKVRPGTFGEINVG